MEANANMSAKYDFNEINQIIKEYFVQMADLTRKGEAAEHSPVFTPASVDRILEAFEKEEKKKAGKNILAKYSDFQVNKVPQKRADLAKFPRLYTLFVEDQDYIRNEAEAEDSTSKPLSSREKKIATHLSQLKLKHSSVLQSARQIFSIAINCLQQLHNIKDGNAITDPTQLTDTIENYQIQLDKYDQILKSEGDCDRSKLFSEAVMTEHKNKLIHAKVKEDVKGLLEVLLSLRVNAL